MELSRQFPADSLSPRFDFHLGMSYAALGEPQRAQEHLTRAIALEPARLQYRYQFARVLSQSGQYADAAEQLRRCIAMDSTYLPARFQLGLAIAAQRNDPFAEMEVFTGLVERNPNDVLSLYHLSEALKRAGQPDSAAVFLRRALAVNPRYVPALIALSNHLNGQKRYAEALPLYLRADSVRGGNKDLLFQIGECYRRLGELPSARSYFRRAIALDSMNGLYHAQLAYAYFSDALYDSSIASYRTALLFDEENAQYHLNLALVYAKLDDRPNVLRSYAEAVRVMHPELAAAVFYDQGTYCFQKKLWKEAVTAYGRAIDIDPALSLAYYFKGSCLMQLNEHAAALPLFTEFLSRTKESTEFKGERYSAQKMSDYIKELRKKK
ncbi:MAG: tetratricopeptide repeat protein [Bacteroidetes bacterium]|nr:tetratricopeptide repeat protein [Bacteroidota bacterium]